MARGAAPDTAMPAGPTTRRATALPARPALRSRAGTASCTTVSRTIPRRRARLRCGPPGPKSIDAHRHRNWKCLAVRDLASLACAARCGRLHLDGLRQPSVGHRIIADRRRSFTDGFGSGRATVSILGAAAAHRASPKLTMLQVPWPSSGGASTAQGWLSFRRRPSGKICLPGSAPLVASCGN